MADSRRTATRVTWGAISLSSSSHFPAMLYSQTRKPVALPPGRRRVEDSHHELAPSIKERIVNCYLIFIGGPYREVELHHLALETRGGRHRRRADRVLAWGFLLWAPANAVLVESRLGRRIDARGTFRTPLGRASVPSDPTLRNAGGGTGRASHYKEPRAFPSYSSSGTNSAVDFPSRNPRSTAGHRSGIPCRASQRHPRNALPISSSALRLSTPRASSAFTVSRTSSFSRIKLRATLAISLLGPGMGSCPGR
jgi:hypothetical protein